MLISLWGCQTQFDKLYRHKDSNEITMLNYRNRSKRIYFGNIRKDLPCDILPCRTNWLSCTPKMSKRHNYEHSKHNPQHGYHMAKNTTTD